MKWRTTLCGCAGVVLLVSIGVRAEDKIPATTLTIYSTTQPGAVDSNLYAQPGQFQMMRQSADYYSDYNSRSRIPGYAVVKQERTMDLPQERCALRFSDVAALIDPTTVSFESLTDPTGTHVLEQNFEFDLVGTQKLMERYLDRPITLEQVLGDKVEIVKGTLLSTSGGVILRGDDGKVQILNGYSRVEFPDLPGGLITKPTLVWDVSTEKPGPHRTRVGYQTEGMTWWADYNLTFAEGKDANSGKLDVGAWVSIINQSGASYPDSRLKLIAGDVHRTPKGEQVPREMAFEARAKGGLDEQTGFEEKAFFEYHLYTLGRSTTLPDNSTKQIELFPTTKDVPCDKVLVYYGLEPQYRGFFPNPMIDRDFGSQCNKKVDIYLRFRNEEKVGLGIPLPSGRIRVNKLDPADQSLEFIGEDVIDHTPKDEEVLIRMGNAFDVVGERKQVDFKVDTNRQWMDETIEVKIRNHKNEPVKVIVKENLYRWVNWEVTECSGKYEKVDSRTIHIPVAVAKDGEETVRYKVHYTW